jgi:hypothetical protein
MNNELAETEARVLITAKWYWKKVNAHHYMKKKVPEPTFPLIEVGLRSCYSFRID